MAHKVIGWSLAVVLALIALALLLAVDWAAMLSGDSDRVQEEVEEGSGYSAIIGLVVAVAAFLAARWAWDLRD